MKRKPLFILVLVAFSLSLNAVADFDTPVVKKWTVIEKDDKGKDVEVEYMTLDGIEVHEGDPAKQPQPPVVTPGTESTQEQP
ncbi:MAG: hypothetical protein RBU21_03690, partial [FCB group bacterium]|nr:hypothetical protein [FCB group bacterium]